MGLAAALAGCGGKSTPATTSSATTYSVGGSITGLSGTVVLQDNGADNLPLSNNGPFTFLTSLAPGSSYDVTVLTQPANQTCSISGAMGTLGSSITSVMIVCVSNATISQEWVWRGGSESAQAAGSYGTQGTAAAANTPGARRQPGAWTDANGNFWLFGGYGTGSVAGSPGMLDDLWEYSPPVGQAAGQWVWQGGSDSPGAPASYGSAGMPAAGNTPGAREGAATWSDAGGNLWLFGGASLAGQSFQQLDDLWEFQTTSMQWVWVSGSSTPGNAGSYGTLGVAAVGNLPPSRTDAVSWVDGSGVFWLFGGAQFSASGSIAAVFNDLWSYNPGTGMWTWVAGSSAPDAVGVYGTQGSAAAGNTPGARMGASGWVDANGNFWLFGGTGLGAGPAAGGVSQQYGDLWEYQPSSDEWTWIGGADTPDASGLYGTLGTGAAGNGPGARASSVAWQDSAGDFWLFGGYGYDQQGDIGALNDLWEYVPGSGVWTWVGGSASVGAEGSYGTQNSYALSNAPGARQQAVGWRDSSGNLWLFGGYGFDAFAEQQDLNDLWSYTPAP